MTSVWRHSKQKGSALLLLLSLADYADERGISYPSIGALARKTRMTERNVQKLLRQLETDGDLVIDANSGPYGANRYRLIIPGGGEKFSPPRRPKSGGGGERGDRGGVNAETGGGEPAFTGGVNQRSPDPSYDPSYDPSVKDDVDDDGNAPKSSPPVNAKSKTGKRHRRSVTADEPTPPVAPPPPPAEVEAVSQALLERGMSASMRQAQADAEELLRMHPPDWIIRAAVQTSDRRDVQNPYGYMVRTLENWQREDGPRPARGDPGQDSEEDRRRRYIPDEYADVIIG